MHSQRRQLAWSGGPAKSSAGWGLAAGGTRLWRSPRLNRPAQLVHGRSKDYLCWRMNDSLAPGPAPVSKRIAEVEALLREMTLAEKVGQMSQWALMKRHKEDAAEREALLLAVRRGQIGSFLNARSLELRNELQKAAVEESRLRIPLIFGRDVIHGFRTIFPIPLGLGATFDPQLVEQTAAAAAHEAREAGIDWTFAPMVDVTRDPRWGRVAEGYGEDPYLASKLGAAMVRGFQGQSLRAPDRVAACAKHYVAYGASESGKDYNTTWVPEHLLRELYLPPFRACVNAGVATIMSGFNDLNGVPVSGNALALRHILKGELGFSGFVVSDWAAMTEMLHHGLCANEREVAHESVHAGVDMEMASKAYHNELERLVQDQTVPVALVDEAVRRILAVKHELGLFERPYVEAPSVSVALGPTHLEIAKVAARESIVLLKHDPQLLPLTQDLKSLAVVGPLADDPHNPLGCWSFDGDRTASVTLLTALRRQLPNTNVLYSSGVDDCRSVEATGFEAAEQTVKSAELAIVVLGEDANISGECRSRAFLGLPGVQSQLLQRLERTGTPLVLVFMAGRPLTIGSECELARAALYAWHGGTMAGEALAEVLCGHHAPSGKLPISFPRSVGQIPIYYNFKNTGRPPKTDFRGIPLGSPLDPVDMDSSYLDVEVTPQFPFGFGLSYTTFEYGELSVSASEVHPGHPVVVSVKLTNTGPREGVETVQLYVRDLVGSVTRPVRELKGFRRVRLDPGESTVVDFKLTRDHLAFYDRDLKLRAEPGHFEVFVGGDSRATLSGKFELLP